MKIETEEDYKKAMSQVEEMWDEMNLETPETEKGKQFLELCNAVKDYEDIYYPIPKPEENEKFC